MENKKELTVQDIKNNCDLKLNFKSTKDLDPYLGIIGQERALSSIKSAMEIKSKGFNLYVSGSMGIGKTNYVLSVVTKLASKEPIPHDYCYIYNFEEPSKPIYVELEAGMGFEFKTDMEQFISNLLTEFSTKLYGDTYEKQKKDIKERFNTMKQKILADFDKYTFKQGFKVHYDKTGISFSPVFNGSVIDEKQFNDLSENDRKYYKEKSTSVQEETVKILKQLDAIDINAEKSISDWETNVATFISVQCIKDLKVKYKSNLKLQNFFYSVQSDIVKNVEFFKQYEEFLKKNKNVSIDDSSKAPVKGSKGVGTRPDFPFDNYRVNIIIDNDDSMHAPVVQCKNPTYYDLFGKLEFESGPQGTKTNFTMLRPGLIHKANGGYLILNIKDLSQSQSMWEALKRIIRSGEITIDSSRDIPQPVTIASLKPEAIPINIQFILIGSEMNYLQLCKNDADFKKLFKFKAEFEDTYDKTEENMEKFARYVAHVVNIYHLLHFSKDAVIKLLEYSAKFAADSTKLSSNNTDIRDLCIESSYVAENLKKKIVNSEDIEKAYANKKKRYSLYDDHLNEMIKDNALLISTSGSEIGQINGLTIVNNGDFCFGKPVRITANTFIGKSGIVNIEREVALSGTSHSKGVLILSAYIGEKYGQDFPLSFNASICFEQLYNGVDGDSASSTELYAILSSLASVPIKQNFAVTGSVNQKGEIQPIGGVSEKIEGFFNVCKNKGLTNNCVLIPKQNVKNLSLNSEIISEIEKGNFHIYPVSTIEEGIELLTDEKMGEKIDGKYEEGSISEKVYNKLKAYADKSLHYNSYNI